MKKAITFCKIKAIDIAQFITDITLLALGQPDLFNEVEEIVSAYNTILLDTLNKHAHSVKRVIAVHPEIVV